MDIHIRNMVCDRCVKAVAGIFKNAGVEVSNIRLGVVATTDVPDDETIREIKFKLAAEGFEWLDDPRVKLTEQVKTLILQLVQQGNLDEAREKLSHYLSARLFKEYHYISQVFSTVENTTIEQYFILQKIEKVKEWLAYNEYTLNEMAFKLGYSSVAHLSAQFKKVTGLTPTRFRQLKDHTRKPLDKVS